MALIPQGTTLLGPFQVPAGFTGAKVSLSADGWPDGTYTVTMFLSADGGLTFPISQSTSFTSPFNFPLGKSHVCWLEHSRFDIVPTHAQVQIDAPAPFNTTVSLVPIKRVVAVAQGV